MRIWLTWFQIACLGTCAVVHWLYITLPSMNHDAWSSWWSGAKVMPLVPVGMALLTRPMISMWHCHIGTLPAAGRTYIFVSSGAGHARSDPSTPPYPLAIRTSTGTQYDQLSRSHSNHTGILYVCFCIHVLTLEAHWTLILQWLSPSCGTPWAVSICEPHCTTPPPWQPLLSTSMNHNSILTPSWEFCMTLGYEWNVIQWCLPYRWTIWVCGNMSPLWALRNL